MGIFTLAAVGASALSRHGADAASVAGGPAPFPARDTPAAPAITTTESPFPTESPTPSSNSETSTPAEDPQQAALAELTQQRARDLPRLSASLDGRYVLQIASKAEGTVDAMQTASNGSHTFYDTDILAEYRSLDKRFWQQGIAVYLVGGMDFGTASTIPHPENYWVTLVDPGGISSYHDGRARCRSLFPELDDAHVQNTCLPRKLTPYGQS